MKTNAKRYAERCMQLSEDACKVLNFVNNRIEKLEARRDKTPQHAEEINNELIGYYEVLQFILYRA